MVLLVTTALTAFGSPHFAHWQQTTCASVPEPGSLLVFGTGILLGFKTLIRKA
jgi:hypothetical protein